MKNIDIDSAEFREQCLDLVDDLDKDGVVIVKDGKPVARLIAYYGKNAHQIGSLKGKMKIKGDIVSAQPWYWWREPDDKS